MEVGVCGHRGLFGGVFNGGGAGDGEGAAGPGVDGGFDAGEGELVAGGEFGAEDFCGAFEELWGG